MNNEQFTEYEKENMIAVLGIVTKKSKVLIGKLNKDQLENFGGLPYVFPGGRIEGEETPKQTVQREVLEESGYEVEVVGEFGRRIHPSTKKLMIYFHCEVSRGEASVEADQNADIAELLWVEIEELKKYMPTLHDGVKMGLKKYQEAL